MVPAPPSGETSAAATISRGEDSALRILFVYRDTNVSGVITYLCTLAPALRELGHQCFLMARGGPYHRRARAAFDEVCWHPPTLRWAEHAVARAIRRWDVDVVAPQTTSCARHAVAPCQAAGIPLVMHIHNRTDMGKAGPACAYADRIIAIDVNTGRHIRERYPDLADKVFVSGLPVDPVALPATFPHAGDDFVVMYCARLSRTKGQYAFAAVEAVPRLCREVPGFQLWLVGGSRGLRLLSLRLQALATNHKAGRQVVRIVRKTLHPQRLMAQSDVVIGAAYVALEALSLNRRVIGAGFEGLFGLATPDRFAEGMEGKFGDSGATMPQITPDALAEAILQAYTQQREAGPIVWGHDLIAAACNPRTIAEEVAGIYQHAIGDPPADRRDNVRLAVTS